SMTRRVTERKVVIASSKLLVRSYPANIQRAPAPPRARHNRLLSVTRQLRVPASGYQFLPGSPGYPDRSFPVPYGQVDLLIGQIRPDFQRPLLRGYPQLPAARVRAPVLGAAPLREHLQFDLIPGKNGPASIRVNQRPAAEGIRPAIGLPQLVVHQLAPVAELKGEPIPSHLISAQRVGAPFAVHPAQ